MSTQESVEHTQGDWFVSMDGKAMTLVRANNDRSGQVVASTFVSGNAKSPASNLRRIRENEANARLIAAAPKMLRVLKAIIAKHEFGSVVLPSYLLSDIRTSLPDRSSNSAQEQT